MVSLTEINEEVESRYAPFVIDDVPGGPVTLRSALRLPKGERDGLFRLVAKIKAMKQEQVDENPEQLIDLIGEAIEFLAAGDGGARLLTALDGDLGKLVYVFELYSKATQLGEALSSAN